MDPLYAPASPEELCGNIRNDAINLLKTENDAATILPTLVAQTLALDKKIYVLLMAINARNENYIYLTDTYFKEGEECSTKLEEFMDQWVQTVSDSYDTRITNILTDYCGDLNILSLNPKYVKSKCFS